MRRQIAVRLPNELVEFLDQLVDSGEAPSRASVVARALERERRRRLAERDAAILAPADDFDLNRLAEYGASVSMDDLDECARSTRRARTRFDRCSSSPEKWYVRTCAGYLAAQEVQLPVAIRAAFDL